MKKRVAISCLLNSYNKPELLPDAVDSVLDQTYQDFELIIMDGGSTAPGMRELLTRYQKHPKIRVFFTGETEDDRKTKIMHSVAMNKALQLARGKYITYLCDDDVYLPRRFAVMVEKMESNPSISVVYCNMRLYNMDKAGHKWNTHVRKLWGLRGSKVTPYLPLDTYIDLLAFMHKKSCLAKLAKPYFPESPKSEQWHYDGMFAEKLGEEFVFHPVDEILFEHRYTPFHTNYGFFPRWRIYAQQLLGLLSPHQFRVTPEG